MAAGGEGLVSGPGKWEFPDVSEVGPGNNLQDEQEQRGKEEGRDGLRETVQRYMDSVCQTA